MKLVNLSFYVIRDQEHRRVREIHLKDSALFRNLTSQTVHVKAYDGRFVPVTDEKDEYFFRLRPGYFSLPLRMCRFVKKQQPAVILSHAFIFPVQQIFLNLICGRRIPLIIQHHAEHPSKNFLKLSLQKLAYSHASAYLFTSKEMARPFVDAGIIPSIDLVHEMPESSNNFKPVPKEEARKRLGLDQGTIFLWVGRLDSNKDPMTVLQAFHTFLRNGGKAKLYMIYASNELGPQVSDYILKHDLAERIILTGTQPKEKMEDWFSAADYFIAASHYESSGYALCEAMACGCVPVVTDIPSCRVITGNGTCGFLYPPGDHEAFTKILLSLEDAERERLAIACRQRFGQEFSFEALGRKLQEVIEKVSEKQD